MRLLAGFVYGGTVLYQWLGAGGGNRTRDSCLEGKGITTMQRPQRSRSPLRAPAPNTYEFRSPRTKRLSDMPESYSVRRASPDDLDAIRSIYNEGIEDRLATLESEPKSPQEIAQWWSEHDDRYVVLVATQHDRIVGWASLNHFSARCAHSQIADLSVYVARQHRGEGVGFALLTRLAHDAAASGFRKIVLHALDSNEHGKRLYRKAKFTQVGVFREHGMLDGRYVDVVAMERLLR
jgi:L-amino acid N-acyltransferase YncA